jgi:inorganic pyrophosphatase
VTAPVRQFAARPSSSVDTVNCLVEIPKGSRNKYEYDPELGAMKLDRFLSASVVYPTDYGFIPETLSRDGDALDALICVSEPTFPGCIVFGRPIAVLDMEDEHGVDPHVLCVPVADPGWDQMERLADVPSQLLVEISHFFATYKDLDPNRHSSVKGWRDREAAWREIEECRRRYLTTRAAGPYSAHSDHAHAHPPHTLASRVANMVGKPPA